MDLSRRGRCFPCGHTWVRVASNSLQASLLGVESGSPASSHAYIEREQTSWPIPCSPPNINSHEPPPASTEDLRGPSIKQVGVPREQAVGRAWTPRSHGCCRAERPEPWGDRAPSRSRRPGAVCPWQGPPSDPWRPLCDRGRRTPGATVKCPRGADAQYMGVPDQAEGRSARAERGSMQEHGGAGGLSPRLAACTPPGNPRQVLSSCHCPTIPTLGPVRRNTWRPSELLAVTAVSGVLPGRRDGDCPGWGSALSSPPAPHVAVGKSPAPLTPPSTSAKGPGPLPWQVRGIPPFSLAFQLCLAGVNTFFKGSPGRPRVPDVQCCFS